MTGADAGGLLAGLEQAAIAAGAAIMEAVARGVDHRLKADLSPVSIADEAAEKVICTILERLYPKIPIVAEERASKGIVPAELGGRFFLVDPLDGTKEFLAGRPDYTVNIALVEFGCPVAGVIVTPAAGRLHVGSTAEGAVAADIDFARPQWRGNSRRLHVRTPDGPLVAVASRSHRTPETDRFLAERGIADVVSAGSSLKFCLIAEGKADIYPRFGRTMEWDIAAGDAILRAAGGRTVDLEGRDMIYGKRQHGGPNDFENSHFIAAGGIAPKST